MIVYYLTICSASGSGSGYYLLIFFAGNGLFFFFYFRSYSFLFLELLFVSLLEFVLYFSFKFIGPLNIFLFFYKLPVLWISSSLYSSWDYFLFINKFGWGLWPSFFYFLQLAFNDFIQWSLFLDLFKLGDLLWHLVTGLSSWLVLWLSSLICAVFFFIYNWLMIIL